MSPKFLVNEVKAQVAAELAFAKTLKDCIESGSNENEAIINAQIKGVLAYDAAISASVKQLFF